MTTHKNGWRLLALLASLALATLATPSFAADADALKTLGISPQKFDEVYRSGVMAPAEIDKVVHALPGFPDSLVQLIFDKQIQPGPVSRLLDQLGMPAERVRELNDRIGSAMATQYAAMHSGWKSSEARMLMELGTDAGKARELKVRSLEVDEGAQKTLSIFMHPADLAGTALLSESQAGKADDQWVYMPKIKRIKKISMSNQSSRFMGSEFSYEDIAYFDLKKYHLRYLGDQTCETATCWQVEMIPAYEHSGYSRLVGLVDRDNFLAREIAYFDHDGKRTKTLRLQDYVQFQNRFWRATRLVMINEQSGNTSVLRWNDYRFDIGLKNADFSLQALKRAG